MGGGRRGKKKLLLRRPKGKKDNNPTADGSSSAPPPPWIDLPKDLTANILRRLGPAGILENAQKVCTTWRSVCSEPSMWRVIDMKNPYEDHEIFYSPDIMCRRAVDRSLGELIDINIEYFGTDDLLSYISERSSNLKRLRLGCCNCISGEGLTAAVKKFPKLEELHLFFMSFITAGDIETIGLSCPMLKSFTFNNRGYRFPLVEVDDSYALIIAKHMPNLHHLRLFGNRLSNDGLKAIFDGCPNLESLDLRQCFSVDLQLDFGRICSERVKDLKRPFDSTLDYEWDDAIFDYEGGLSWNDDSDDDQFGDYGDCDYYEDYEDLGYYGNYDDFTNPFNDVLFPSNLSWLDQDEDGYL